MRSVNRVTKHAADGIAIAINPLDYMVVGSECDSSQQLGREFDGSLCRLEQSKDCARRSPITSSSLCKSVGQPIGAPIDMCEAASIGQLSLTNGRG